MPEQAPVQCFVSYEEFATEIKAQGVVIGPHYRRFVDKNKAMGRVIRVADLAEAVGADLARPYPGIGQVSTGPINTPDHWQDDIPVMTLTGFINFTHGLMPEAFERAEAINVRQDQPIMVCGDSELNFNSEFSLLVPGAIPPPNSNVLDIGSQIIIGSDGRPLAYRKGAGVKSCLLLRPALINGVPVPAGYILGMSRPCACPVIHISSVTGVGVMRLSEFTLSEGERYRIKSPYRLTNFNGLPKFSAESVRRASSLRMPDIISAVGVAALAVSGIPDEDYPDCLFGHPRETMRVDDWQVEPAVPQVAADPTQNVLRTSLCALYETTGDLAQATSSLEKSSATLRDGVSLLDDR